MDVLKLARFACVRWWFFCKNVHESQLNCWFRNAIQIKCRNVTQIFFCIIFTHIYAKIHRRTFSLSSFLSLCVLICRFCLVLCSFIMSRFYFSNHFFCRICFVLFCRDRNTNEICVDMENIWLNCRSIEDEVRLQRYTPGVNYEIQPSTATFAPELIVLWAGMLWKRSLSLFEPRVRLNRRSFNVRASIYCTQRYTTWWARGNHTMSERMREQFC